MSRMKLAALILLTCTLLLAAVGTFASRYSHAAAWRVSAGQRPWVERTLDVAAAGSGRTREDWRRTTRPRLWHRPGQLCVILRSHRHDIDGSYRVCFDRKTGQSLEERYFGHALGRSPMADPLWKLVW